jgi:hypothetical protein
LWREFHRRSYEHDEEKGQATAEKVVGLETSGGEIMREKYKARGKRTLVDTNRDGWVVQCLSDDYYLCTVRDDCGTFISVGDAWSPRIEDARCFSTKQFAEYFAAGREPYRLIEHVEVQS